MTHSTHFIYGYMEGRKCFLFNDALNTFYLRLYGGKEGNGFFYLTTHSTHFIYGLWKEGNVLYLNVLSASTHSTHLRLYGGKEGNVVFLTTHSTHFIYGYMEGRKCFLFNDTLNTFYLRLYGRKEMFFI